MASIISAGTTSGTSLNLSGDTSGVLQLATNGSTTAVTIDTSQNVGIGTASPTKKLSINGDIRLGDGGGTGAIFTDATNGLRFMQPASGTSSTESMRIDSSGNVGIGTSSPGARLGVQVSSGTGVQAYKSTTGGFAAYQLYTANENVIGTIGVATTNDTFYLGYSTTPVLTWNSNCVGVGGALPSTSGAGITFPATQSASSNANTLDDYEEGTWTPTDASGASLSLSILDARYTKIGRMVECFAQIGYPSTGNGNAVSVGGLPFTSASTAGGAYGAFIVYTNHTTETTWLVSANATTSQAYKLDGTAFTNANISTKQFRLVWIYEV